MLIMLALAFATRARCMRCATRLFAEAPKSLPGRAGKRGSRRLRHESRTLDFTAPKAATPKQAKPQRGAEALRRLMAAHGGDADLPRAERAAAAVAAAADAGELAADGLVWQGGD